MVSTQLVLPPNFCRLKKAKVHNNRPGGHSVQCNENKDKKNKSQNRLAREHKCLNRTESVPVTDNSDDKSSLLLILFLECVLST